MDEVKKSPLAPAHYPARRSSQGQRQLPKATEKAQDGQEPPAATSAAIQRPTCQPRSAPRGKEPARSEKGQTQGTPLAIDRRAIADVPERPLGSAGTAGTSGPGPGSHRAGRCGSHACPASRTRADNLTWEGIGFEEGLKRRCQTGRLLSIE
jgi:hypothetical protein